MTVVQNAYPYRMPAGIPGAVNREQAHSGEPNQMDATLYPAAFGDFVKMGSNSRIQALAPGDASAAIYGMLERAYPGTAGLYTAAAGGYGLGASAPTPGGRCTVMTRGYATVLVQGTTAPAKGSPVYVRLTNPPSGGRVGGLEAAPDATSANTLLIPNCIWMGAADAQGNSEIRYNI